MTSDFIWNIFEFEIMELVERSYEMESVLQDIENVKAVAGGKMKSEL